MKTSRKDTILECIGKVYEKAQDSNLNDKLFSALKTELDMLADYFKLNRRQAFLMSVIFSLNYKHRSIDHDTLIDYFDCNPVKLLAYRDDMDYLAKQNYVESHTIRHGSFMKFVNFSYVINREIPEALLNDKALPELKPQEELHNDPFRFLEQLSEIVESSEKYPHKAMLYMLKKKISSIINNHSGLELIKWVKAQKLSETDEMFLLKIIWESLEGRTSIKPRSITQHLFSSVSSEIAYVQGVMSGKNLLFINNLLEKEEDLFFDDIMIKPSLKTIKALKNINIFILYHTSHEHYQIKPENINKKRLFFNLQESQQIESLQQLIGGEKFSSIQKRLKAMHLPAGINVLLHGFAGTGKTESVMQLARASSRQVYKLDISQLKSMWYGQSEKKIKEVFTTYREFMDECDKTPILLFNEADAIISKRLELGHSNTQQTENTIQNILLEELENFTGIFIATTNLTQNIDPAFERRFLYKIEFHPPDRDVKSKIWHDKIPELDKNSCKALAVKFNFTGGQIDNICRKKEIHEIIHGEKPDIKKIHEFCQEEQCFARDSQRIGFIKNQ